MSSVSVRLEVLHVADCPNLTPMLRSLSEVTDAPVVTREIGTDAEAARLGMAGSPTLLVNGSDPFTVPGGCECGVACRLYRNETGQLVPVPSIAQLRHALAQATPAAQCRPLTGAVLDSWRARAAPTDRLERQVHQMILHTFASTGRPPGADELDPLTGGTGRSTADVLGTLHHLDAIRLTPDGTVAAAYPFSANPTRHRVRIHGQADVYAMCAIDALGIAAMLDTDTRIESADPTTRDPITVTMSTDAASRWDPTGTVVFLSANAGDGPSAESCCGHLNFFTSHATAAEWAAAHPHIPGQILTQADAEDLSRRLFQPLLTPPPLPRRLDRLTQLGLT